jgi:spermidine synthase
VTLRQWLNIAKRFFARLKSINSVANKNTPPNMRSGVRGEIVHSTSDHLGTILVKDYRGYRALTFDSDYAQSGYSLTKPYAVFHEYIRIMLLVLGFATPKHATLLGLGGGSLLRSLHHHLHACQFQVVELRAKVLDVAQCYFELPNDARVKYAIADANYFLNLAPSASSDVIFSDLFDAYFMSPLQVKPVFIEHCHRVLKPTGWLVINFHHLPLVRSVFFKTLNEYFPRVLVFSGVLDNHIVFACNSMALDLTGALARIEQTPFMPLFEQLKRFIEAA